MSAWTEYVTNYYNEKKKTNPNYEFKNALVDASKERKKNGGKTATSKTATSKTATSKKRSSKRRSLKNKK